MEDHTKHAGYSTVNELLGCKSEDTLKGTYKRLTPDEKAEVQNCFDVFAKEKKALEKKLEEFNKFASRTKKLNAKIKLIPLREDETSKDLFGSESDSSPRSVGDSSVQPAASTSLLGRVLSVVSSSSSSSKADENKSKKRKTGSTLFDSFYTF
jgi:hypothetical protein